ncbi:MAG: site-2 protease family protein [Planctomycetota bacterium]
MGGSLLICRIRGIPIRVHWSFVLLPLFLLYRPLVSRSLPGLALGAALVVFIVVAIVAHELAHALVGRHLGAQIHNIVLWPLGGFTELSGMPPAPSAQVKLSLAGPLTNLGLGLLAFAATGRSGLGSFAGSFVFINLALGVLNLVPAHPLDGAEALRAFLRGKLGYGRGDLWASRVGVVTAAGVILLGVVWVRIFLIVLGALSMIASWQMMKRASLVAGPRRSAPRAPQSGDFRVWRLPRDELRDEIKRHRRDRHADREVRERVDRLLKQISEQGMSSLSDDDRQFLKDAADQFNTNRP